MFPVTDTERIFFVLMINAGDVLFALAFGLIAQITMQMSQHDETQKFIDNGSLSIARGRNSLTMSHCQWPEAEIH